MSLDFFFLVFPGSYSIILGMEVFLLGLLRKGWGREGCDLLKRIHCGDDDSSVVFTSLVDVLSMCLFCLMVNPAL